MRDENEGLPFAFGPSAGFEGGGLLPSLLYAPGPGAVSEFPGQQVQWVGGVAGQQEVQPHAPWQQFHDATAQQLVVQVQPQGSWLHSSLSLDSGGGQQGGAQSAGRLDPATMAAKLASAREKNRAAQQRFRARQREKQKQAGEQCTVLQEQIDELEGDNEQLERQNRIYEKVLAVRDAMLQTFTSLHPPSLEQRDQAPPMRVAAQGLAKAIKELPSEGEMDAASPAQNASTVGPPQQPRQQQAAQQAVQQAGAVASSSSGSGASVDGLPSVQNVTWNLADPHRSGVAAQLDGSALREVQSIPSTRDEAVRASVVAMTEPEHLMDYYRQWQAELSVSYVAAKASGFDADGVADVEAVQERMTQVWWHVGEMKPAYLCYLAHAALPENSAQFPLWREIAAEVLPQLDETQRALLRRSWHAYSKRLAKIAVGVSRWVRRLQEYALQPTEGLVTNANSSLELLEITSHIAGAVQEEYVATMEFVAEQALATTPIQKAYINHASAPFLPDIVAIDYNILLMDSQQRQARAKGAPSLLAPAGASSGANVAPQT